MNPTPLPLVAQGGSGLLVQHLAGPGPSLLEHLELHGQPHLLPEDVATVLLALGGGGGGGAASGRRAEGNGPHDGPLVSSGNNSNHQLGRKQQRQQGEATALRRVEVRACRHVPPSCGPALQQVAVLAAAGIRGDARWEGTSAASSSSSPPFRPAPAQSHPREVPIHVVVDAWSYHPIAGDCDSG